MKTSRRRVRRAFTLLEVLMVIVIIGLLVAFVAPSFFGTQRDAEIKLTRAAVESGFGGALDMYRMHMGKYPQEDEGGLAALYEKPGDEEAAKKWAGPYIKDPTKLKDAWGNEFIYKSPGQYHEDSYDLSSAGPDGQEGTDDDINNWKST